MCWTGFWWALVIAAAASMALGPYPVMHDEAVKTAWWLNDIVSQLYPFWWR